MKYKKIILSRQFRRCRMQCNHISIIGMKKNNKHETLDLLRHMPCTVHTLYFTGDKYSHYWAWHWSTRSVTNGQLISDAVTGTDNVFDRVKVNMSRRRPGGSVIKIGCYTSTLNKWFCQATQRDAMPP